MGRRELTRADFLRRGGVGVLSLAGAGVWLDACGSTSSHATTAAASPKRPAAPRFRVFHSRPDLRPIEVDVVRGSADTGEGYLFLAPSSGPGQRGPLIADDAGEVVWFKPTTPLTAMNLRAALYRGKPVLTWWEGKAVNGIGRGECVVVDSSYREVARFDAGHDVPADLHELLVTPHGTALVTANEKRTMNLSKLGGASRFPTIGGVVREIDVRTGRVVFDWHSFDHVALSESHTTFGNGFDYFHVNSIEQARNGDLIVSARNTWAIYRIDRGTGKVVWRLGGKRSDFAMGKGTFFAWQHDARLHGDEKTLSLFDDGAQPKVESQSRGLVLALDTKRMRATLTRAYTHRPALLARFTGSTQVLPNGNVLVGWGSEPWFTEYSPGGRVVLDARFPRGGQTYRVLRFPWVGRPAEPPTLVSRNGTLYASWNGATEIAAWELRTGARASALQHEQTRPRRGFETTFVPRASAKQAAVVALDRHGKPLGTSATIAV
jgi:hypothetical protein